MSAFNLPAPVAAYVAATNAFDIEAFLASFADGALVNDHRNEFLGLAAIRDWAQRAIIGGRGVFLFWNGKRHNVWACDGRR